MHLREIQETLADIFLYLVPAVHLSWRRKPDPVLAALARTCRAFKEPALDGIWMVLYNLLPLSRCLLRPTSDPDSVRCFQVLVALCLPTILRSSIHLAGHLHRPTGISFEATHVAFDTYIASMGNHTLSCPRIYPPLNHSSRTSAIWIAYIAEQRCLG